MSRAGDLWRLWRLRAAGHRRLRWIVVPAALGLWFVATARDADGNPRQARPWQITAYSTLPLRALSRLWGRVNDFNLPIWLRNPSFRFYAWLFGANLDEMADPDLTHYRNLGEFFYRELRPGVRPIDSDAVVVSPSDGKVLQFGQLVENSRIERVKGVSYSLEAFLGVPREAPHLRTVLQHRPSNQLDETDLNRHAQFAEINGISYTVDDMVGSAATSTKQVGDAVAPSKDTESDSSVGADLANPVTSDRRLYYAVVYLAPGDYHRFHSPVNWVAQLRRHFVGELFSVAPYFQSRLANLFCLNERVALLGTWKYGFFSMTPVGATNVGSIAINFDRFLRTNTRYIQGRKARKAQCYEATYSSASPLLGGYPLHKGEEMGGFHLGSTVVLVFEAPSAFSFVVRENQHIKMGQPLGVLRADTDLHGSR